MIDKSTFDVAWKYHTLGFCVIPSGGGADGKAALIRWKRYQASRPTDDQLQEWQGKLNPQVWAMPTGPISGLFVVDCDTEEASALMESAGLKPHVRTPKGCHYYCKWPSWVVTNHTRILPGIDVRGRGGYVNFCGSNGKATYEVLILPHIDNLYEVEQLPKELRTALRPQPSTPAESLLQEAISKAEPGNRNESGLWLGCQLRDNGITQVKSVPTMRRYAAQVTNLSSEPYTEDEALASLQQAFTRPPRETGGIPRPAQAGVESYNLTDLGNAERLVQQYGSIIRYCYERKKWLIWTGKVWSFDTGAKIRALAKATARSIYHEVAAETDEKRRKAVLAHAVGSENETRIRAMINLAQSEQGVPITVNEMDTNPMLFNAQNGTIDLKTGELLPHRKEDLITVIVPTEYDAQAEPSAWLWFLDEITNYNLELQRYLQKAIGYSLTGDTSEQILFFLYGLGNNGKSTFLTTIRRLLGGYGERVNTDLFMARDRGQGGPKEGIANLCGKRFVIASELDPGQRLAVSLIKDMTGGETLKADRKYEHEFEFQPTHKIWLAGNHKPVVTDTTLAMWRRLKLIPFTVTIPEDRIDRSLPDVLRLELPQILTWAVRGCLAWQKEGLHEPEVVTKATARYQHDQDILIDFIEDCCDISPSGTVPKALLRSQYVEWCTGNSVTPLTQKTFKTRLIERGIEEGRVGKERFWRGIGLKTSLGAEKTL